MAKSTANTLLWIQRPECMLFIDMQSQSIISRARQAIIQAKIAKYIEIFIQITFQYEKIV